jgi:ketosteroid isomerase-like protein
MGIDEPKDRAVQLLKWLLDERDHERFLAALADDATWTIPGNWPRVSGVKDKAAIVQFVRDESVCAIREYMDTLYADKLIFSPGRPS